MELRHLDQIRASDGASVGGKGLGLGMMANAGLPVPAGFCVTAEAHRRCQGKLSPEDPLAQQIVSAYAQLGGGPVAVRSSATDEDGTALSFAGQQETILGVQGEEQLLQAIARCWHSLQSERAQAYRRQQGAASNGLAMAVVVQNLVPAEVAGVLFTRDPLDPTGRRMLVEASWGLGEAVVSGQVTPDRWHLDRESGAIADAHIHSKTLQRGPEGIVPVPPEKQLVPCLSAEQLQALAELGRRVEALYGQPRDVEWAWAQGQFWLLQARPITTPDAAEREQVRQEEIAHARSLAEPGGTVWSRFNLSEVLPEPTPMTWAIVRRFMSGKGGFGLTYRDLGFKPHPSIDEIGTYDLICGRTFCNLSREPRTYSGAIPYEHPFELLRREPHRALNPQARPNFARAGALFWLTFPLRLPFLLVGSMRFVVRLSRLRDSFAARFSGEIIPAFRAETEREWETDPAGLTTPALLERLEFWIHRTLYDFARDSLKPTMLAGFALAALERRLVKPLGPDRTRQLIGELTLGVRPEPACDLAGAIRDLQAGRLDRESFLAQFGHRGRNEMELASPRWHEDPSTLPVAANRPVVESTSAPVPDPVQWLKKAAGEANLGDVVRQLLEPEARAVTTYLALRESAKHHLMRGYALIRRFLVELDRRHGLAGGIFYLLPEELPRLTAGEDLTNLITQRRRRRAVMLSLEIPQVLFSDDLEAIGRPQPVEAAEELRGAPLSAGVAEGPALVLEEPASSAVCPEPYILVCPSTDPAWVPLFANAAALVMESGGVLSHGAIVAREFGLPAVAGIPGVTRRLTTGQRLRVDGATGRVSVLSRRAEH